MGEHVITLRDGRKLAFCTYGKNGGIPVILLHGTPGSRIWFEHDDDVAKKLGMYLIAPDRPGFGLSDKKPQRQLLDYAADIEELANFLQLERIILLGVSGGGAYVAAASYKLHERVQLGVLVSTATPFINGKAPKEMALQNRFAFFLSKHFPWPLKKSNEAQKKILEQNPQKYKEALKKSAGHLAKWDVRMLQNEDVLQTTVLTSKEAYRQGVDEALYESKLLTQQWGFPVADIDMPIHIWHGEHDTLSPINEVKKLAAQLPSVKTHYVPEGGHFLFDDESTWERVLATVQAEVTAQHA